MFEQSFLSTRATHPWTTGVGFLVVIAGLLVAVITPLLAISGLPARSLRALLVAPAPPAAPAPPPPPSAAPSRTRFTTECRLCEPRVIPPKVVIIDDRDTPPVISNIPGVTGGVPSGTGQGLPPWLGYVPAAPPPPPKVEAPKPATPQRIRVGGNVQAAKQIYTPPPAYPPLAKQAGVQGVVKLNAVIAKDGTIQELTAVSGHVLLIPAAMNAIRSWVYKPTLLNGEPVEVVTQIDVNFTLTR